MLLKTVPCFQTTCHIPVASSSIEPSINRRATNYTQKHKHFAHTHHERQKILERLAEFVLLGDADGARDMQTKTVSITGQTNKRTPNYIQAHTHREIQRVLQRLEFVLLGDADGPGDKYNGGKADVTDFELPYDTKICK